MREWLWQWSQDSQSLERASDLAQRASMLDDSLPRAHQLLGQLYLYKKQHDQALTEAERAVALDPNDADGYARLALVLICVGRSEEAIGVVETAMRLNPRYPAWYLFHLGHAYSLTRRTEEAIATNKRALTRSPNQLYGHVNLTFVYEQVGRLEEARAEAAEILRINPTFSLEGWRQALPYKDPAVGERIVNALRKAGLK